MPSGKNHGRWLGGIPNCIFCGNRVSSYKVKKCWDCYVKNRSIQQVKIAAKLGADKRWAGHIKQHKSYYKSTKKWREENRGRFYFIKKKREIQKKTNGLHTFEEWVALKVKFNFMCLCCKQFEPNIKLTEDHIIPISMGGSNNISNIQPLCQNCNSKKYTKTISYLPLNSYELINEGKEVF